MGLNEGPGLGRQPVQERSFLLFVFAGRYTELEGGSIDRGRHLWPAVLLSRAYQMRYGAPGFQFGLSAFWPASNAFCRSSWLG